MLKWSLVLAGATVLFFNTAAFAESPPTMLVVGLEFVNVGASQTTSEQLDRIPLVQSEMIAQIEKSGKYRLVMPSPDLAAKIKARPNIPGCGGCQFDWGREAGTDLVLWGNVNKVSNLILFINLNVDDVKANKPAVITSVDIRGDNDNSWLHGIRYIVKHNLLGE